MLSCTRSCDSALFFYHLPQSLGSGMNTVDNTYQHQAPQDPGPSENVTMQKKPRRDTTCFVPYRKSGYKHASQGLKISLFSMPRDPKLLKKWERALHCAVKEIQPYSVVCEHNFQYQFIERHYTDVIGGQLVQIPRVYTQLRSDAALSALPGAPAYLSKKISARRRTKTSMGCRAVKHAKKARLNFERFPLNCLPMKAALVVISLL